MTETFEQKCKRFNNDPDALIAYATEKADERRDDKLAMMAASGFCRGRHMGMTAIVGHAGYISQTLYKYKGNSPDEWLSDFVSEVMTVAVEHLSETAMASGLDSEQYKRFLAESCAATVRAAAECITAAMQQAVAEFAQRKPN